MTAILLAWAFALKTKMVTAFVPLTLPNILPMDGADIDYDDDRVAKPVRSLGNNIMSNAIYIGMALGIVLLIIGLIMKGTGNRRGGPMAIWGLVLAFVCFLPSEAAQWVFGFFRGLTGV